MSAEHHRLEQMDTQI